MCRIMLYYVAILEGTYDSLTSCNVFIKLKINTNVCRSAESDSGINAKDGQGYYVSAAL